MIYIVGWGIMLLGLMVSEVVRNRSRIPAAVVIAFVAILAIFRGAVGTDTNTYEFLLESVDPAAFSGGVEPLFMVSGWLFKTVTGSAVGAVRLFALVLFGVLFYFLLHSNRNERFFLLSFFLPSFIYQYSMNTLRLGLASAVLLLVFQYIRRYRYSQRAALSIVALAFHYSSLFNLGFLLALRMRWTRWASMLGFAVFVVCALLVVLLNNDYFLMKLNAYQQVASPGRFSGLSKVVLIAVMLLAVIASRMPRPDKFKLLVLAVLLTAASFGLATVSYAGLRFLDLLSFSLPLAVMVIYNDYELDFDWAIKLGLSLVGLISVVASYRNYLQESGQGPSPFLPYHFLDLLGGV